MIFAHIKNDSAMRAACADRDEIRFMNQSNGTTVCSYMISGPDTFRDAFSLEARGIVFDETGAVIARPLHKFFNVGERPSTLVSALDWTKVYRVMLKRDGSMIHTVKLDEDGRNFTVKSKKSFESDVARGAKKFLLQRENYIKFCTAMASEDKTAIFEWTSPTARIVVGYQQDELQLLHIRDNFTGEYLDLCHLKALSDAFGIPLVYHAPTFDPAEIHSLVETTEGIEGWVVQFEDGQMVKLKTKWYMDRHHAMTFLRIRDIAQMVIDESIDDLKAKLVGDGINTDQIVEIERRVVSEINYITERIDAVFEPNKHLSRKDFAILLNGHPLFSLLMAKFSGKEPDVKGFFAKHHLNEMFDLTQINLTDSVAEVE